ncbi:unnamed protein product [Xylocopa violacea]|uniref:Uncharacterized protein n=1 Tax=Xylocopa violacea TaxID=135666 RepID=A0ABP1P150_XYLVO
MVGGESAPCTGHSVYELHQSLSRFQRFSRSFFLSFLFQAFSRGKGPASPPIHSLLPMHARTSPMGAMKKRTVSRLLCLLSIRAETLDEQRRRKMREGEFDCFFLATFHKSKLLFSLLNEWNGTQRSYDFKGMIPNVDRADRRNNERGRITRLLDANCAGRLSLHLLRKQSVRCMYMHHKH